MILTSNEKVSLFKYEAFWEAIYNFILVLNPYLLQGHFITHLFTWIIWITLSNERQCGAALNKDENNTKSSSAVRGCIISLSFEIFHVPSRIRYLVFVWALCFQDPSVCHGDWAFKFYLNDPVIIFHQNPIWWKTIEPLFLFIPDA